MKLSKIIVLSGALLSCGLQTIKPVSETTANVGSALAGIGVAGLAGAITYHCVTPVGPDPAGRVLQQLIPAVLVGGITGGLTWFILYKYLHTLTPTSRFAVAQALFKDVQNDSLVSRIFVTEQELYAQMNSSFGYNPLNSTRNHFATLSKTLSKAQLLIREILQETTGISGYEALNNQANYCLQLIPTLERTIATNLVRAKLATALDILNKTKNDSLVARNFDSETEMFSHMGTRFGTSWPLVVARDRLISLAKDLATVQALSQEVLQDCYGRPDYEKMGYRASELPAPVEQYVKLIEGRIAVITNSKDYNYQTGLFENHKEEERRREYERQLQSARLEHERQLQAAKLQHERELQAAKQGHESWEKYKERRDQEERDRRKRQHQQQLLNQNPNRPAVLNVG